MQQSQLVNKPATEFPRVQLNQWHVKQHYVTMTLIQVKSLGATDQI